MKLEYAMQTCGQLGIGKKWVDRLSASWQDCRPQGVSDS
jgi:hypothetical protein